MAHLRNNVVGYVALFLALCGGAYAAGLSRDSVRSKHIQDGQVKTPDLADSAVTADKVAGGAVTSAKFGNLPAVGLVFPTYNETGGNFCQGSNGPFPNNTLSSVEFTDEAFDTTDVADPLTAGCYESIDGLPSGTYVVTASLAWASNGTGMRSITLDSPNASAIATSQVPAVSGGETRQSVSGVIRSPGSVDLRAYQNSGAPLAINSGRLSVAWVGP
jgi:hypothetical protein